MMKRMITAGVLALVGVAVGVAPGEAMMKPSHSPVASRPAVALEGTAWVVQKYVDLGVPTLVSADAGQYLVFDGEGGVSGYDGCNTFSGSVKISGNTMKFGAFASTKMYCADTVEQERLFYETLGGDVSYVLRAGRLILINSDDAGLVLRPRA